MKLSEYLTENNLSQAVFGAQLGVTQGMINQWCNVLLPTPVRCVAIEQITNGQVTRKDLRPDDWHLIWPELADNPNQQEAA